MTTRTTSERKQKWAGMNWCRQDLRLAIYLRDGLACVWCGASVEDGAQLSLDHLKPANGRHAADNSPANLVCSCSRCNSSRGNRSVRAFAAAVAGYLNHGVEPAEIESHVRECVRRDIAGPRAEAKTLIARRGSAARVLASM